MRLGQDRRRTAEDVSHALQRRGVRVALAGLAVSLVFVLVPPTSKAQTPNRDIASSGPLTNVYIGNELGCQVAYQGDAQKELYPPATIPGDCGTLVFVADKLYGPNFSAHGSSAASGVGAMEAFTPLSQSGVEGSGSSGAPYRVTTGVRAGSSGIEVTEVDSYVTGQESYRTDVTLRNTGGGTLAGIMYRAGDCYLQENDQGFGFVDQGAAAAGCSANANNSPAARIEQWYPITGGNQYMEGSFSTVWQRIGSHQPFPNTCECTSRLDNGAGLSWQFSLGPGETRTFSHYTTFSPRGVGGPPGAGGLPPAFGPGGVISAPSNRRCVSRRRFRIRIRRRGLQIEQAIVFVNGRRVAVRRGRRLTAPVDLRGLPRGRFTVTIRVILTDGRLISGRRRYRTCTPKRRGGRRPRL